jgi:hypothetical protein
LVWCTIRNDLENAVSDPKRIEAQRFVRGTAKRPIDVDLLLAIALQCPAISILHPRIAVVSPPDTASGRAAGHAIRVPAKIGKFVIKGFNEVSMVQ